MARPASRAGRGERERDQRDAGLGHGELVHDLEIKRHQDGEPDRDAHRERAAGGAPAHHRVVGKPYKNFCEKGGRFGPHNVNQEIHLPDVEKPGSLIYLTYFNAGLRVYNIRDPRLPVETGWFIPPAPASNAGVRPRDGVSTQTEDVLVDTRGNIFVTDKNWGLWVLRYSGPDQPAPTDR